MPKSKLWHKRVSDGRRDPTAFSSTLRQADQLLKGRRFAAGLATLNSLAEQASGSDQSTQVLSTVADSQMLQGQFAEAADTYSKATKLAADSSASILRPAFGRVVALLKNVQIEDAATAARLLMTQVSAASDGSSTSNSIAAGGTARVPARMQPPATVARRLGRLFLAEGESALATEFLNSALSLSKSSFRAQLSLAELTVQQGNPADAHAAVLTAWQAAAKPTAKMLAAIPLLVHSANRTGQLAATTALIALSLRAAKCSVRSRATLLLVQALRAEHQTETWIAQATAWLQSADVRKSPVVAAEMRKALLTEQRIRNNSPADEQAAASAVLNTPKLGFHEYLSAAKELVRSTYFQDQIPDIEGLVDRGVQTYGAKFKAPLLHAFALACMMANQHATGLPLLMRCISLSVPGSQDWGSAMWAIARAEGVLGFHSDAARYYQQIGACATVPTRFRLQAKLEWTLSLTRAGQLDQIAAAGPEILSVLASVSDYETLLDFARQLMFAPEELQGLRDQVFALGEKTALQTLASVSTDPNATLEVLFKLTRRRDDQFRFADNIAAWEALSDTQKQWLWTQKTEFWELIQYVCNAYARAGTLAQADALADAYMTDGATPINGMIILGINKGLRQIEIKSYPSALAVFRDIVTRNPSHLLCAYGHYWLALDAVRQGLPTAKTYADNILRCIGPQANMLWYWQLEAKALCILADFDVSKVSPQIVRYSSATLSQYCRDVMADLASLGA